MTKMFIVEVNTIKSDIEELNKLLEQGWKLAEDQSYVGSAIIYKLTKE